MPDINTIRLKNYLNIIDEITATAVAITPGMLIELTTGDTVRAHNVAGGNVTPIQFAIENTPFGGSANDAYPASARIQTWVPQRGDEVLAILADGQNVAIGARLESNGAGALQAHVPDVESFESAEAGAITVLGNQIVGIALEAIDLSDSSGGESSGPLGYDKRIRIRIV